MNDDLVTRLEMLLNDLQGRIDATKLAVIQDTIDRIAEREELNKALTDKVRKLTTLLDAQLGTPCEQIRHPQEVEALEAKLAKAVVALEGVVVGGNHLAIWLPDAHPTAETEPLAALEKIGAGASYDVWCCWRSIMQARDILAELKGEKND